VQARIPPAPDPAAPAGFWARYAAWSLDAALLLPLVALLCATKVGRAATEAQHALQAIADAMPQVIDAALGSAQTPVGLARQLLVDPALADAAARLQSALATIVFTPLLVYAMLWLPWAVLFEASAWQATPGKRALGLQVTDAGGRRLKAGHALLRHLSAGLSWLTLNLGQALALVPPAHLALHDRVSGTRVVRRAGVARMAPWARLWLVAQGVAMLVAIAWLLVWLQSAMQAAMQQALGL
jgi:uncharacterized RDD family membrane protein YckC